MSNFNNSVSEGPNRGKWSIPLIFLLVVFPFFFSNQLQDADSLPKQTILFLLLSVLLIYQLASSRRGFLTIKWQIAFGISAVYSLYRITDSINPADGLQDAVSWLVPGFTAFALAPYIQSDRPSFARLQNTTLLTCAILCGIVLIQWIQFGFRVPWNLAASFGNKNFLAESLVLLTGLSLGAVHQEDPRLRRTARAVILLTIAVLLLLRSTNAMIGLAIILLPLMWTEGRVWFKRSIRRIRFAIVLLILSVCTVSVVLLYRKLVSTGIVDVIKSDQPGSKSVHYLTANTQGYSVGERLILWKNTLQLITRAPLAGQGSGDWKIQWVDGGLQGPQYIESGIMHYEHPHNECLLMLAEQGFIGWGLWLCWLFLIPLSAGWKRMKSGSAERNRIMLSLASLCAFFFTCNLSYPAHRVFSATLAGVHLAILLPFTAQDPGIRRHWRTPVMVALGCCLSLSVFSFQRLRAEVQLGKALKMQAAGNFQGMLRALARCDKTVFPVDHTATPIAWYQGFAHFHAGRTDSAMVYFQDALRDNPNHVQLLSDIGACYLNTGQVEKGEQYIQRALAILPGYQEALFNAAVAAYNRKQWHLALDRMACVNLANANQFYALHAFLQAYLDSALGNDRVLIPVNDTVYTKQSLADLYLIAQRNEQKFLDTLKVCLGIKSFTSSLP